MKKVFIVAIALLCSIAASAQQFLSAKEMLKMMSREYAAACHAMGHVSGYKQKNLVNGTAFYKQCKIEEVSLASNPDFSWVKISNVKQGISTCVAIYCYPGDMDVWRVETTVFGKKAALPWISQLKSMGFKTTKTDKMGNDKEWVYKKNGESCEFTLHFDPDDNGYCLTIFDPNYTY